jgi:hypothetical protein
MKQLLFHTPVGRILLLVARILGLAVSARVIVYVWQNPTPVAVGAGLAIVGVLAVVTGALNEMIDIENWRRDLHKDMRARYLARR